MILLMGTQTILSPVSMPRITDRAIAERPSSLDGLRVALLDNQKANAGSLLDGVGAELESRHADIELVREYKIATSPSPDAVMGRLQECDAVVLAIAD